MKNRSIWINSKKKDTNKSLNNDISCDVLIVGGGIAGLSVAYFLKNEDKKIVLIDKDFIGYGATSKNTGKLDYQQGLIYHKIIKNYNKEVAKDYLNSQKEAINEVVNIVKENNIKCHLEKTSSCVFSNDINDEKDFNDEIKFYEDNNIKYHIDGSLKINYPSLISLSVDNTYIFNPFEYLLGLKTLLQDKVDIYEKSICKSIDKDGDCYRCLVNDCYIEAKQVVVCTHYPIFIVPYFLPFKSEVQNFYIGAFKNDYKNNIQILSYNKPVISMRYYEDYMLYGSRSHSSSTNLDILKDYSSIKGDIDKYFHKKIEYFYHTNDIMTYDNLPFIGEVASNLYIATGFNKWGNTNGTIAGKVLSLLIMNKDNKYIKLFNPRRGLSFDKIKNIVLYNIKVGTRYIFNKINPNMNFYKNDVTIKYINGKRCGIYRDEEGNEHIVSNICPHMKCNLIFNYLDKTWDCPCHGSRFSVDGDIIEGPSVYSIKINSE